MDRGFRSFEFNQPRGQPLKIDIGRIEGQRVYDNNKTLIGVIRNVLKRQKLHSGSLH